MKSNTKSSITLPRDELALVKRLQTRLKLKTKVEVVRAGLQLLRDMTEREALRQQYRDAARAVRQSTTEVVEEMDGFVGEGL